MDARYVPLCGLSKLELILWINTVSPNPVPVGPLLFCKLPFLRSDGDFCMPPQTPMTPSPLSPTPPPSPTPNPLLETKPGLLGSVEDAQDGEAVEEQVLAVEEVGRLREGDASEGLTSVVKQGPYRLRQLPFFFFFTPSSPPAATPPIPGPELEDWGRL